MTTPAVVAPDLVALAEKFADVTVDTRGRKSFDFDDHGIAAFAAALAPAQTQGDAEPVPWRCIKPHCPTDCDSCTHAIRNEPGARLLIVELLDAFANDGHGAVFEDGDSAIVDKARAFVRVPEAALAAPRAVPDSPVPTQPSEADVDFWMSNRANILDAINDAGFHLMSNKNKWWLRPLATPAPTQADLIAAQDREIADQVARTTQAARKPLTAGQIDGFLPADVFRMADCQQVPWHKFARAIEAAHGITESAAPAAAVEPTCMHCSGSGWVEEGDPETGGNKVPCERCPRVAALPQSPRAAPSLEVPHRHGDNNGCWICLDCNVDAERCPNPPPVTAAPSEPSGFTAAQLDAMLDDALKERDHCEDMADQLAAQIAAITGEEIGEHSSGNEPWRNAMLAADDFIAAQLRALLAAPPVAEPIAWLAENQDGTHDAYKDAHSLIDDCRQGFPVYAAPPPAQPSAAVEMQPGAIGYDGAEAWMAQPSAEPLPEQIEQREEINGRGEPPQAPHLAAPPAALPVAANLGDSFEPTMNIHAQPGTVVRFRAGGGYDWEKKSAIEAGLVKNSLYTVKRCDIGHSKTEVLLDEIEGRWNSCLFAAAAQPDAKDAPPGWTKTAYGWAQSLESIIAEEEDAKNAALPVGVVINSYAIDNSSSESIRIERARQAKGEPLWAVRLAGMCLDKTGEWEWEPMPSSRDDEFLARCRFATVEEAIDAAIAAAQEAQP